mgnify:CR=1 FL=1
MRTDAELAAHDCPVCARDRVREEGPRGLPLATYRPDAPFQGWSVDLADPFPADGDGMRWAAVAVDVYTKWVEIALLPSKHAFVCAR